MERNRLDKYKSSHKRQRKGFKGIPAWKKGRVAQEEIETGRQEIPPLQDAEEEGSGSSNHIQIDQAMSVDNIGQNETIHNVSASKLAGKQVTDVALVLGEISTINFTVTK